MRRGWWKRGLLLGAGLGALGAIGLGAWLYATVPAIDRVSDYDPPVPMRIYSQDGELIGQFGAEHRRPRPLAAIPKRLRRAFLAAEDAAFYDHPGIDVGGILRALWVDLRAGAFVQGASTITQQVARTFLLTNERTLSRKLRETVLAFEIEAALGKPAILHRYLNQIYLGSGAYGVAAAARTYYGKPLDALTLAEAAMLAGLPKGPAHFNPVAHPEPARHRRDYVLHQMLEQGWAPPEAVLEALETPIHAHYHPPVPDGLPLVAETVRRRMVARYGEETAYQGGLRVVTTIDFERQRLAQAQVQQGLLAFTRRHGFRGPVASWSLSGFAGPEAAADRLAEVSAPGPLRAALVTGFGGERRTRALLASGATVSVPWSSMAWARPHRSQRAMGPEPDRPGEVVAPGDVVYLVRREGAWRLTQRPRAQGALVALDPGSGAVRAMVGAFAPGTGHYNRAVQARRQPGSAFKPFLYAGALERGLTPATLINDAPVVFRDTRLETRWTPENYSRTFHGPTRLRTGLVHSRNLVTVRLLQRIGVDYARGFTAGFGFAPRYLPDNLSLALGSASLSPLRMTAGYAALANGGRRVTPFLIERVMTCGGQLLADRVPASRLGAQPQPLGSRILSRQVAFQMTDILQGVVENGTGWRVDRRLERPVAGKTGTTNRQRDAWFLGYSPDLATGVWVGFDRPRSLGEHETGSRAASPIWAGFMAEALADRPVQSVEKPPGLIRVRIDSDTGLLAGAGGADTRLEWFRAGNAPTRTAGRGVLARGESAGQSADPGPDSGPGLNKLF